MVPAKGKAGMKRVVVKFSGKGTRQEKQSSNDRGHGLQTPGTRGSKTGTNSWTSLCSVRKQQEFDSPDISCTATDRGCMEDNGSRKQKHVMVGGGRLKLLHHGWGS